LAAFVGAAAGKPVRLELLKQAKGCALADIFGTRHALRVRWNVRQGDAIGHNALKRQFALNFFEQSSLCAPRAQALQFPDI